MMKEICNVAVFIFTLTVDVWQHVLDLTKAFSVYFSLYQTLTLHKVAAPGCRIRFSDRSEMDENTMLRIEGKIDF
ncbi:hypothetical protein GcM1_c11865o26 [Golovinomyces cichoracearum]|uniref:Uncharacterized protein n=1 Tax=Golovinomyces cichoracearum TaxID=62708 RepID=A0A420ILF1_9PEZI|nr:hypothetical protein GcM1_c11865o26 [Golovinomyces cichoracearum]